MKQMVVMLLAWSVGAGFSASAQTPETVSNDVTSAVGLSTMGVLPVSTLDTPPEKPEGDEQPGGNNPPAKPGEGGETGGDDDPPEKPDGDGTGGSSEGSVILTGAYPYIGGTNTLAGQTLVSTTSDQNVILAMTNAYVTVSNCVLNKTGDMSSEDNSNFYAVNATVASKTASMVCIAHSTLTSEAKGANGLFASGSGSTIYAYDCTITNKSNHSRGLDATYAGTLIGSKLAINTSGDHCAAFATDRGNGSISVTEATMATAGQGSPLIYSTGAIEVNGVTGTATGAQIAGIEGLSTIRIRNSVLSGSAEKASEPVANGVIIYQSNSGDYTAGTATFEVSDSTLSSAITNSGAMFYVTHSEAVITVQNTELNFDTSQNYLLKAAGNDGKNGWGSAGTNGAGVVFTAIDQTLQGNISVDGISSNDLYLVNSTYTGTFLKDNTYTGDGGASMFIDSNSTWTVTGSCTLKCLTAEDGATIKDGDEKTVPVVDASGTELRAGTSDFKITVSCYVSGNFTATNITDFTISRTAFDAMYGTSGSGAGESGGSSDTGSKTYYFKPHAPTNGVVGVSYNGTKIYPDMDHKYWLDAYWTNGVTVTVDFSSDTTSGYFFADGSSVTSLVITITENRIDIYPPAGYETAYLAQAKSGATYYLTLKEAIDAAKNRARIVLNDNVTLTETLTVTNSITLNLNTNVVTVGSALTPAFLFTANATITNGTITSSDAANAEDCVLLRFTDCTATLSDVTLAGDCCLLFVDEDATVTVTNNCAFTCESAATVYCSSSGMLTIAGDTYKSDGVVMVAPDGCYWEDGELVEGTLSESLTAGVTTDSYGDAQSATNAAVAINANKADCIEVPTGVDGLAKATYLTKVEATVTGDNCVVVDLTPAAQSNEQVVVDAAITNDAVVAALVSTNETATATIAKTTPGLYYWIQGGTDVGAVSTPGKGVLSTNGGSVELTKPTLDATQGRAFFKIAAGVAAPVNSNGD